MFTKWRSQELFPSVRAHIMRAYTVILSSVYGYADLFTLVADRVADVLLKEEMVIVLIMSFASAKC